MNKAFVREPDQTAEYCPQCGSKGEPVGGETLLAFLSPSQRAGITDPANFCPAPKCGVAYFDCFGRTVPVRDLPRAVYPKDETAPICPCFGLTHEDIEQDVLEGSPTRTKAVLEKAKSPAARCRQLAANGRPCTAYVQKYYIECLNSRKPG